MKVKSIQGKKGDCILHSFKNSGACRSYKEILELNIKFQKHWAKISNKTHKQFKEIMHKNFEGEYFLYGITFLIYALNELKLNITEHPQIKKVKNLPKDFTGIIIVDFNHDSTHAVGVKNGHVCDSHWKKSMTLKTYPRQKLEAAFQFNY